MGIEMTNLVARGSNASFDRANATANTTPAEDSGRQVAAAGGGNLPVQSSGEQSKADLGDAVRNINDYVQQIQRTLRFSVDEGTGRTVVKVMDSETEEVIRQFPAEEVLALARHLQDMDNEASGGSGFFLDAQA